MTVLAAFQGNGFAHIGTDSRATDSNGAHFILSNKKVTWDEEKDYLFAVTGATRGGNLIQQGWVPPQPPAFTDIHGLDKFMTQIFIPQLRDHFMDSGFEGVALDGSSAEIDAQFLVAVQGVIYPIYNDYCWDRDQRKIYTMGSGGDIALGVMDALEIQKFASDEKGSLKIIKKAVEIACKWNAYCALPIVTETQKF